MLCRFGLFLGLIGIVCYQTDWRSSSNEEVSVVSAEHTRHLHEADACDLVCHVEKVPFECLLPCMHSSRDLLTVEQIRGGGVVLYILGSLYMLVGVAIVCDDFFVPMLEIIVEKAHIGNDVAGATLMAAGGSAPELFTSFIGTFSQSAVGFGTIVGSAVFNVLFVVAMCALFSEEVLTLTWWPLFRDSIYYVISLSILAIFFSMNSPNLIELYEAIILFILYIGYVILMSQHTKLYDCIQRCRGKSVASKVAPIVGKNEENPRGRSPSPTLPDGTSKAASKPVRMNHPSTFRAGLMSIMFSGKPLMETAGHHVIYRIHGSAKETFEQIDQNQSGTINREELRDLLESLDSPCGHKDVEKSFNELDQDSDGKISFDEFLAWYLRSEERIYGELKRLFDKLDTNNSASLDRNEICTMIRKLHPEMPAQQLEVEVATLFTECGKSSGDTIEFQEYHEWYFKSSLVDQKKQAIHAQVEDYEGMRLFPLPKSIEGKLGYFVLAPITYTLVATNPPFCGNHGPRWRTLPWGLFGFFVSIFWIGGYTYLMVWWVEITGATIGIPPATMGLTFLAAGTSVPDLLSSIIVAKKGEGDMAVSSSLGSNIFDVLVGLPLPWLCYLGYTGGVPIPVFAAEIGISIGILVAMIVIVIGIIAVSGWKLTKPLGYSMIVLYLVFLAQDTCRVYLL